MIATERVLKKGELNSLIMFASGTSELGEAFFTDCACTRNAKDKGSIDPSHGV